MTEELKIAVTATYNGKDMALGFDFSEFLNEGKELTESYMLGRLNVVSFGVVRSLVTKKACPIILNK